MICYFCVAITTYRPSRSNVLRLLYVLSLYTVNVLESESKIELTLLAVCLAYMYIYIHYKQTGQRDGYRTVVGGNGTNKQQRLAGTGRDGTGRD